MVIAAEPHHAIFLAFTRVFPIEGNENFLICFDCNLVATRSHVFSRLKRSEIIALLLRLPASIAFLVS